MGDIERPDDQIESLESVVKRTFHDSLNPADIVKFLRNFHSTCIIRVYDLEVRKSGDFTYTSKAFDLKISGEFTIHENDPSKKDRKYMDLLRVINSPDDLRTVLGAVFAPYIKGQGNQSVVASSIKLGTYCFELPATDDSEQKHYRTWFLSFQVRLPEEFKEKFENAFSKGNPMMGAQRQSFTYYYWPGILGEFGATSGL